MTHVTKVTLHLPLHHWHLATATHWLTQDGWQLPVAYMAIPDSAGREIEVARQGFALIDVSAFAKISLLGHGLSAITQALVRDHSPPNPGELARWTADPSVLVCRLRQDHLLLLCSTIGNDTLERRLAEILPSSGLLRSDATTAYAGFCLVGPRLVEVMSGLTPLDVSPACPFRRCESTSVGTWPNMCGNESWRAAPLWRPRFTAWKDGRR